MEKQPEPNMQQGTETPSNSEQKKVRLVSVEEIIPNIRPSVTESIKGINYNTNKFDDRFLPDFVARDLPEILEEDAGSFNFHVFRDRFKGKIIVDLGAGYTGQGYVASTLLESKAYIGVEKFDSALLKSHVDGTTMERIRDWCKRTYNEPRKLGYGVEPKDSAFLPEVAIVEDDMLSFLQRLPDKSVSIFIAGIDIHILPDMKYSEAMKKELARVLDPEGGCLEVNGFSPNDSSNLLRELKEDPNIGSGLIGPQGLSSDMGLFIKTEDIPRSKEKYTRELKELYEKKEAKAKIKREEFWKNKK